MEATDLAYIAGILDGEGYIGIVKAAQTARMSSPNYRPIVQIGMCETTALNFIAELFGGKLKPQKQRNPGHRNYTRWHLEGPQAGTLLRDVLPYLKVKRLQAELTLKLVDDLGVRGRTRPLPRTTVEYRTALYSLCKAANVKGPR